MVMNGDGVDKNKKQKMWRRDILRTDDTNKMKEIMGRLKKQRKNESGAANPVKKAQVAAKTSIQQT